MGDKLLSDVGVLCQASDLRRDRKIPNFETTTYYALENVSVLTLRLP